MVGSRKIWVCVQQKMGRNERLGLENIRWAHERFDGGHEKQTCKWKARRLQSTIPLEERERARERSGEHPTWAVGPTLSPWLSAQITRWAELEVGHSTCLCSCALEPHAHTNDNLFRLQACTLMEFSEMFWLELN